MNSLITNPGFRHIVNEIFENLDNLSLLKCLQVSTIWYDFLCQNVLCHRRKLGKQIEFHTGGIFQESNKVDEKIWCHYGYGVFVERVKIQIELWRHL